MNQGARSQTSQGPETPSRKIAIRVRWGDVVRLLASWLITFLALLLTAKLLPGFSYTSWGPLLVAAAATGLVGMIVRPVLVELSAVIGWIAVALATLFGQAIVVQIALSLVPGVSLRLVLDRGRRGLDDGGVRDVAGLDLQRRHR